MKKLSVTRRVVLAAAAVVLFSLSASRSFATPPVADSI